MLLQEELWVDGKNNVEIEFDQLLSKFSNSAVLVIEKDNDLEVNDQRIEAAILNLKGKSIGL